MVSKIVLISIKELHAMQGSGIESVLAGELVRVLSALEKTQALFSQLVIAGKLRGNPTKSGIYEYELDSRSDANVRLLDEFKQENR